MSKKIVHPTFDLKLDRRLLTERGGVRHLLVDVKAPVMTPDNETDRPPLDLALVIDASGSMQGEPLDAALTAAVGVVEALADKDRVTVVSFADDIVVHAESLPIADEGRGRILAGINEIVTRGCTNLCGGWRAGVKALVDNERPGAQRRLVLLSDGHANRGVVDPEQLGLEAAGARNKGVYTTSVGIGDGYSTTQLRALCENGGGNLHHAARPQEIVEVVLGELGQILATVAENVELRLELPTGVTALAVGPFPTRDAVGGLAVDVGTFVSGASRRVAIRLHCPPATVGDQVFVVLTPAWRSPDGQGFVGDPIDKGLLYAPAEEVATEMPDVDTCTEFARAWLRSLISDATTMVEENDRDGARAFLDEAREGFRGYVRDLPEGRDLMMGFEHFRQRLDRAVSAGLAKEINCCIRQSAYMVEDQRPGSVFCMEDIDKWE